MIMTSCIGLHEINPFFITQIVFSLSYRKEMPARFDVKLTGYAFACGIQEKAEVSLRRDNRKRGMKITN